MRLYPAQFNDDLGKVSAAYNNRVSQFMGKTLGFRRRILPAPYVGHRAGCHSLSVNVASITGIHAASEMR
jgi:hypothetical protein